MFVNLYINSSSYRTSDIASCSISGIEIARSGEVVNRECTVKDESLVCVQAIITSGQYISLDEIFNNYQNYAYVKADSSITVIPNRQNTNREIPVTNYDGKYPLVCTNLAINVGGMGVGVDGTTQNQI